MPNPLDQLRDLLMFQEELRSIAVQLAYYSPHYGLYGVIMEEEVGLLSSSIHAAMEKVQDTINQFSVTKS